jgi:hypothetical protein
MIKDEFNKLKIMEQLEYVNTKLLNGGSLRSISDELNMSKTTFRDRALKVGYIYNKEMRQYNSDSTITIQLHKDNIKESQRTIKRDLEPVILKNNKNISEVAVIKKENDIPMEIQDDLKNILSEVKELLGMKDQLKEVIQEYNNSKNVIDVMEPMELKVDKTKLKGELKGRLVKVYDDVNDAWVEFHKRNNQFKMQDLYSIALLECIEKYSKK